MNDFAELEAELKQLRPAATSADLAARIEVALAEPVTRTAGAGVLPKRRALRLNWFALGLGLTGAAAFLVLARIDSDRATQMPQTVANTGPLAAEPSAPAAGGFVPDGLTRVVYNTRDEGLIFPGEGDRPVRRVRSHSRDTLKWKDPGSGASLRVSYPTESVEFIPVSGQ